MAYPATVTTSLSTLAKLGRKVQGNVLTGFQKKSEEWGLVRSLSDFKLDMSQREVTSPIDIVAQGSGAFIPEGGYEANPKTAAPQELTFTWANYNDRYSYTLTSKYLDKKFRNAELERQAKYQVLKLIEGLTKRVGFAFYGVSTGIMCETTTNATQANGAYTLADGFGQAGIDNAAYLASMFEVDDYVALIDPGGGTLVTDAIGIITAVTAATPSITVTWQGSVDSDASDWVVFANSSGHLITTGAIAHTDYNQAVSGLIDFSASASLFGLDPATYPKWALAGTDSSGGRLSGTRIMKAADEISNHGGGSMNLLIMSQGVKRDLFDQANTAVRFSDPTNMEVLGSWTAGGKTRFTSRKVPPGYTWGWDKSSLKRWTMVEMPDEGATSLDGENSNTDKMEDRNAMLQSFDFPFAFITPNRGNGYLFTGLDES